MIQEATDYQVIIKLSNSNLAATIETDMRNLAVHILINGAESLSQIRMAVFLFHYSIL